MGSKWSNLMRSWFITKPTMQCTIFIHTKTSFLQWVSVVQPWKCQSAVWQFWICNTNQTHCLALFHTFEFLIPCVYFRCPPNILDTNLLLPMISIFFTKLRFRQWIWDAYSHHSIKRTGSIKRPVLIFFKKSLLNVPYDQKNEGLNILSYCLY